MNRILIIHTAFIGDVILLTSLIRETKKVFPNFLIDVIVIPTTVDVLKNNPYIDQIIVFNKKAGKWRSFKNTVKKLRKKKYKFSLQPHSSLTTALLTFFAGIPRRIGFDRYFGAHFLTDKTPFRQNCSRLEKNLDLLRILSSDEFEIKTEIFIDDISNNKVDAFFSGLVGKKIAISPGSIWFTKQWPEDYYKELCSKLVDNGFAVILTGSPDEQKLCERIAPNKNCVIAAGKTSIIESAAIIKRCDISVCNDSGAMHISNAVETDVIVFFGPTNKSLGYFPYRENDIVIERDLDCRPCGSHGHKQCPLKHHNCMKDIKPDEVFDVVKKVLEYNHKQ